MSTFGDTTLGTADDSFGANEVQARKFASFPGGDVSSLTLCCKYKAAANFKGAVYAADGAGGIPGTLLFASAEFTMTSGMTSHEFRTVNKAGGGSTTISAQDIWIAWAFSGGIYISDGSTGGTGIYAGAAYSGQFPAEWDGGSYAFNRLTRCYLTYTTASGLSIPLLNHLLLGD